ncbi:MAG: hypothetical protein ACRDTJ_03995 [Pseudonocardiaceae bacterium]
MGPDELAAYVAHFRFRVLQDALAKATVDHWERVAERWEGVATPRPGGTPPTKYTAGIRERALERAQACRAKADFLRRNPDYALAPHEAELILEQISETEQSREIA